MTKMVRVFPVLLCVLVSALYVYGSNTPTMSYGGITTYGVVNPSHVTPLPNSDNAGNHLHYVLNNLPITATANQQLRTFTVIFYPNTDPTIVAQNLPYQVTLHVARAVDGSSPTALTRTLHYVQSITLNNVVSGQEIDVSQQHLQFQAGDLLALSVPNNAIFLRVGVNNVGLPVGYASTTVPMGQDDNTYTGAFVAHPDVNSTIIQICAAFTSWTYGDSTSPLRPGDCHRGDNVFYASPAAQVKHDGNVIQVSIACSTGTQLIQQYGYSWDFNSDGTAAPTGTPMNMRIKLWRGGDVLGMIGGLVPGVDEHITAYCGQSTTINPIPVQANDYVLFEVDSSDAPYCIPLSNTLTTNGAVVMTDTGVLITKSYPFPFPQYEFSFVEQAYIVGDPQFAGFQGQSFQFHGLADEVFNLVSSPQLQLNSHFVYLTHGTCDYNDTLCFQHPGTYLDVLGFTIPSNRLDLPHVHIRVVSGSHKAGLRVWTDMHDDEEEEDDNQDKKDTPVELDSDSEESALMKEIKLGQAYTWIMDNITYAQATLRYHKHGHVTIETDMFRIEVTNSNYFFNLGVSLLDGGMLRAGHARHTITDRATCEHDQHGHALIKADQHDHGAVEAQLMNKYHVKYPVHGLIGQTWRNVMVCGKHWMGSVQDYVVSDLFGSDYYYNFYKQ